MTSDEPAAQRQQSDPDLLADALKVTEQIIAGVGPEQVDLATPCTQYDVRQLVDHLVGFATSFADKASGVTPAADPAATKAGADPGADYHRASERLVDGYRDAPEDATPVGVVLMETITHGWDLAKATGQPTPYPEEPVAAALSAGEGMLSPEYRGDDKPFGDEVQVPQSASALDRLVGFMGRDPQWAP